MPVTGINPATIPTLIITAARGAEAQQTRGAVILPKPLDLDRLLRAINTYVDGLVTAVQAHVAESHASGRSPHIAWA